MNHARIAELLQPFLGISGNAVISPELCPSEPAEAGKKPALLSPLQLQLISTYIDILVRWNARINLTSIRDPEEIVTRHFGESLFAACHLFPSGSSVPLVSQASVSSVPCSGVKDFARPRVADLGSGAGLPGLPIKLWAPHIALTLIESNQKKATFLREVTRTLILTDVNVYPDRAETLATPSGFDLVTLRAVERFPEVVSIAARLVAPAGRLALLIGTSQLHQAQTILPDFSWQEPLAVPISHSRILLVGHRYC
jgi:16S rRNA (guanine527-N7)-methyltransferase